ERALAARRGRAGARGRAMSASGAGGGAGGGTAGGGPMGSGPIGGGAGGGDVPAGSLGALLIVDDDEVFRTRLARAMERRGYAVHAADSVKAGAEAAAAAPPLYAVVDLRLGD